MPLPPVDIHLAVTPDAAVPPLRSALPPPKRAYLQSSRTPAAFSQGDIEIGEIAERLREITDGRPTCLTRLPLSWDGRYWPISHPLDQIGHSGGGGIGSGPGMAVGAALALKGSDRIPIAILGDGDYLMGVTALWSATHYRIPLLIVVANNHSYFNDEVHQQRVARTRNRPVENRWIGQRLTDPEPDIVMLARAQGAIGIGPVRKRQDLKPALLEAMMALKAGETVVVDVHVAPGYTPSTVSALTQE